VPDAVGESARTSRACRSSDLSPHAGRPAKTRLRTNAHSPTVSETPTKLCEVQPLANRLARILGTRQVGAQLNWEAGRRGWRVAPAANRMGTPALPGRTSVLPGRCPLGIALPAAMAPFDHACRQVARKLLPEASPRAVVD